MLQKTAKAAWEYGRQFLLQGRVADYIPELAKANPVYLGLCVKTVDGQTIEYGDVEQRFTMQSICKVASLAAALQHEGFDKVFSRVMMEPSGDAFNSILKLDTAICRRDCRSLPFVMARMPITTPMRTATLFHKGDLLPFISLFLPFVFALKTKKRHYTHVHS